MRLIVKHTKIYISNKCGSIQRSQLGGNITHSNDAVTVQTFLKLCFCNCPHQPAMSCMHKKISLITERHISRPLPLFLFYPFWYLLLSLITYLFTSLRKTYKSQKDFEAFLKLNLLSKKKENLATIHSFKIKRGLSKASRCLYPGPGARNTRWREQSLPSRMFKRISHWLWKQFQKERAKKVLSNVNNYDSNKWIFFQRNYLKVIPLFDG